MLSRFNSLLVLGVVSLLSACTSLPQFENTILPTPGTFEHGKFSVLKRQSYKQANGRAKNVILMIGDGMGVSTITATRIYAGQKAGGSGEEYVLAMDTLPHLALSKTYNTNQQVSDSAGTATAMMTGSKTRAGVINVRPELKRSLCDKTIDSYLPSITEILSSEGLSIGVVTTARVTHATPATAYAHSPERNWESNTDISLEAKTNGCISISEQLIEATHSGLIDVVLGGGQSKFAELDKFTGRVVTTKTDLLGLDSSSSEPVIGLFSPSHMRYTRLKKDNSTEPSLIDMTSKAIELLSINKDGYFLMVEGGRIDHGHHAGKAELALEEGFQFDQTVRLVLDTVDLSETLVIVTADHSHTLTIAGYPTRGNPILGAVKNNDEIGEPTGKNATALDGQPYTTLGYQNGPGARKGIRNPDLTSGSVAYQAALIPTGFKASSERPEELSETHGGEDVAIMAIGPGSNLISGVMEQNTIYHVMRRALKF